MKFTIKQHFILALVIGLLLRVICLHFVWGPQGLDDYLDNLIPAWRWNQGWDSWLHDYRSPLYLWIVAYWLKLGTSLGIEKALYQIQWVYFFQALCSLLMVYAIYWHYRRRESERQKPGILAMYLVAAYGLMPFVSTRNFMESFSLGFFTLAIVFLNETLLNKKVERAEVFGWILLGFATLVRFQIGIVYFAWGALLLWQKQYRKLWLPFCVGLGLLAAESLIDWGFGRYPFQTLHDYYVFNQDQTKSGIMPWYNTWLTWLGFLLVPFSLAFGKHWLSAIRRHRFLFTAVLVYVGFHSIYPHKEERYLYPTLGLSLMVMAEAWWDARGSKWVRYFFNPIFAVLTTLAMLIFCFVNTQVGMVGPYAQTELLSDKVLYMDYQHNDIRDWMSVFFVRPPSRLIHPSGLPNLADIELQIQQNPDLERWAVIGTGDTDEIHLRELLTEAQKKYACTDFAEASSLSDQLLVKISPQKNSRRQATFYFSCRTKP